MGGLAGPGNRWSYFSFVVVGLERGTRRICGHCRSLAQGFFLALGELFPRASGNQGGVRAYGDCDECLALENSTDLFCTHEVVKRPSLDIV